MTANIELTADELFTVWDEHYADVVSCDRPPLDYELFRAIIAADRARQAAAPVEVLRLAEALKFYADGNHRTTLTNTPRRCGFDWDEERQKLNDAGFFMVCENSNGSEDFVEDGTVAAEALATMASTPASEVPAGWREAIAEIRKGLDDTTPSAYDNSGYRDYAGIVLDAVEDELSALAATPASPATVGEAASDYLIETFRKGGNGGFSFGLDTAVRVTHIPTGIVEECSDGRSQHRNRQTCLDRIAARLAALAAPIEAEAQKAVARDWTAVYAAIDSYIEDYEMLGEAPDGRDASYTPNDSDRALMKDFALGLLSDDAFMAAFAPTSSARTEAVTLDAKEKNALWYEWTNNATMDDWRVLVELTERALAKKNGWRLGGADHG